ncbi:hypothetical protein [Bacteriophage sp.]|nr:hypothetical protein [Bacteriophage sp.]
MSIPSDAYVLQVAIWRDKARQGTLTKEEQAEALRHLRAGRAAAPQAKAGSRATKTAKSAKPNGDDLLAEFEKGL